MIAQRLMGRFSLVALVFAMVAGCGDGGGEEASSDVPASEPSTAAPAPSTAAPASGGDGEQIFASSGLCFTCHGPGGVGTALAPNLTDAEWINFPARPSIDELVAMIKTGIPQPKQHPAPMPPMGGGQLTDDQVRSVAEYVLSIAPA